MGETEKAIRILTHLLVREDDIERLFLAPVSVFHSLSLAVSHHILKDKVMSPNQWLELAFHLCKQRWDESIKWMEEEPMSKVSLMIQIQAEFGERMKQESKAKK